MTKKEFNYIFYYLNINWFNLINGLIKMETSYTEEAHKLDQNTKSTRTQARDITL